MSARAKLLLEAAHKEPNRYALCSVISKRTRQLIEQRLYIEQAINRALSELVDGRLQYELPQEAAPRQTAQAVQEAQQPPLNEAAELAELMGTENLAGERQ